VLAALVARVFDFGEIPGADPLYDLGHFQIEHPAWLPALLAGYAEAAQLPPDARRRIAYPGLRIAARRLGRRLLKRPGDPFPPDLAAIRRALQFLTVGAVEYD
jgi:hypothetical protein